MFITLYIVIFGYVLKNKKIFSFTDFIRFLANNTCPGHVLLSIQKKIYSSNDYEKKEKIKKKSCYKNLS